MPPYLPAVLASCSILLACGPTAGSGDEQSGASSTAASSTTTPGVSEDATDGPATTVPATSDEASTADPTAPSPSSEGGNTFLDGIDQGDEHECDIFLQDCPAGFKCTAYADDEASPWNGWTCTPVADDPAGPGEACMVEGSAYSGIDDCELGAMCWDVDPDTGEGVCLAYCIGDSPDVYCEDPDRYCAQTGDGYLALCLPRCSPIAQDCPPGQACYPVEASFVCAPDVSGDMGVYGDPCEFIQVCDPGLMCLAPEVTPGCESDIGCCTNICDLSDPFCPGAVDGQECIPWYEAGEAPVGYEDVGACALPS